MRNKLTTAVFAVFIAFTVALFIDSVTLLPWYAVGALILAASFVKLPKGVAMMAISYPTDCDEADPVHECSDCEDVEGARIRGVALIKKGVTFDYTSAAAWILKIESGDVIIIPMTRGTFDGGAPKEGPGYGDQATRYTGTDYSATYFDPGYRSNRNFYNTIKKYQNYTFAYKTETLVHITDKPCQILPKAPVADDPSAEVVWEVNAKWSSQNEPTPYTCPDGVFVCFDVE